MTYVDRGRKHGQSLIDSRTHKPQQHFTTKLVYSYHLQTWNSLEMCVISLLFKIVLSKTQSGSVDESSRC